ncbi:MAG: dihydrofolate reductase family protein [Acidobacteria bacterium]|nr:dihydrofolate reductase family protein [Acidobacteriota bacterium]
MRPHESSSRPRIVANLAMSADGKIDSVYREGKGLGSRLDRDRLDELRAEADAIVVGAATIRAEDPPMGVRDPARRHQRLAQGRPAHPVPVVISRTADIPLTARFLAGEAPQKIVAVPADLDPFATAPYEALASSAAVRVLRAGAGAVDLHALIAALHDDGARLIVVEGGGEVVAAFLDAGLLDELRVTVVPSILGGRNAPSPVEGEGWPFGERRRLTLLESERVGDELYLRYEVLHPPDEDSLAKP